MVEPIPVARRRSRTALPVLLTLAAGTLNIVLLMLLASRLGPFQAGERNADPPFLLSPRETWWLAFLAASGLVLIGQALFGRGASRPMAAGCLVMSLAAIPVGCGTGALPGERYEEGFRLWAREHVPADAIRHWNSTLAPVKAAAAIPSTQWPQEVSGLSPGSVTQLPGGRGVVLEWGVFGTWGTSRKIVVCANSDIAPPQEGQYFWDLVQDGVYCAFQATG